MRCRHRPRPPVSRPAGRGRRPRRGAGDPPRRSVGGGGATVEARRRLHDAERPTGPPVVQVRRERSPDLVDDRTRRDVDRDAPLPEPGDAATRDVGIGVDERDDDARDARVEQRLGAGRRAALVRARLERDVRGGAPGAGAGRRQRADLGVRAARWLGGALADDGPVRRDDHAAHPRVGGGPTPAEGTEAEGAAQERLVRLGCAGGRCRWWCRCRCRGHGRLPPAPAGGQPGGHAEAPFRPPSPIRTLTVGPGLAPPPSLAPGLHRVDHTAGCRGLAGSRQVGRLFHPACCRSAPRLPPVGTCTQLPRAHWFSTSVAPLGEK